MSKWADFVISEVSYDSNHLISKAKRHKDSDNGIGEGKVVDRLTITSDIKNGLSYITIYSGLSSWKKGHIIRTFRIGGQPYLRIDGNKVKLDNLGDLPQVLDTPKLDLAPEPIAEEEATPEPIAEEEATPEPIAEEEATPEPIAEEEATPEPIAEEEATPEPIAEEEATPEQLARLEQLEEQIQKLESEPEKPLPSPRGSLPKEAATELPQELDLAPEPIAEEEATPEQLARLEQLEEQIQKLESEPEKPLPSPRGSLPKEAATELPQELDLAPEPIAEEEATPEQLEIINQTENKNKKIETFEMEHEIIQTLRKQIQKLNEIENKLQSL